jgi:spermidine synthase
LSEEDGVRYLHFGTEWIQGGMRIARPWQLELEYQKQMMALALFLPEPQRILQLGLGAAALTKFLLPESAGSPGDRGGAQRRGYRRCTQLVQLA